MNTPIRDLRCGNPLWLCQPQPRLPVSRLTRDIRTDICIVGAGICGAMAAERLSAEGFDVAILERRAPLMGATAATTALLQYEIDTPLSELARRIGFDKAARAWRRSRLALDALNGRMRTLDLRARLQEHMSLYLSGDVLDAEALKAEAQLRNYAGLHTRYLTRDMLYERYGLRRTAALETPDTFTVNPVRMAAGFLRRAVENGAQLYAPVSAGEIETDEDGVTIQTDQEATIRARWLIYATGYEMPDTVRSDRFRLSSTYAIATRRQRKPLWPGPAIIWEASDPYLYVRATAEGRIICGGEDEPFEDEALRDALMRRKTQKLEQKLSALFPDMDTQADYGWCGTFGQSDTGLPGIGAVPGVKNTFAILAFGGNGITFAALAAEMLSARFAGFDDPDADLFAL